MWRVGSGVDLKRAHNPKVAGSNPGPATMNDEGLADAAAANPFRLPRLHPGIGSLAARFASVPAVAVVAATEKLSSPSASGRGGSTLLPRLARYTRFLTGFRGWCRHRRWSHSLPRGHRRRSRKRARRFHRNAGGTQLRQADHPGGRLAWASRRATSVCKASAVRSRRTLRAVTDRGGARSCRLSRTCWRRPYRFLKR